MTLTAVPEPRRREVPEASVPLDEVIESRFPTLRQSLLAKFDDCPLSTLFELRYANGWSTHPQARGTIFHRFAAEALRTMRRAGLEQISHDQAIEILVEQLAQRDVEPEDRVRVPLREMNDLRTSVLRWADYRYTIGNIIRIEEKLEATITYPRPGGGKIERRLTGRIDVLVAEPPNGALVLDWKDTWMPPPERKKEKGDRGDRQDALSYEGYFQQLFYGWLVLMNFPAVDYVTLREFYPRRGQVRAATLKRDDLPWVEQLLAVLAESFDRAVSEGIPATPYKLDGSLGEWAPSPGWHCRNCLKASACPIEREARGVGAIASDEQAQQYAAEWQVAEKVRKHRRESLKPWVETHGDVIVKDSKGRRVVGWKTDGSRRTFGLYVPDKSDRGSDAKTDERLRTAMRESVAAAKRQRAKKAKKKAKAGKA